jgi:WD40 repeat protein
MTNLNPRPNPYVGPRAFQIGEKLYGRDREVRELLDLLIAERIVLLHSPSGAGKSSLVQAGLIPALEEEGFEVLPPMRVNQEIPNSLSHDGENGGLNRYVISVLLSLEADHPGEHPLEQLTSLTLDEYLEQHHSLEDQDQADDGKSLVLIFDQFEEVLTVDSTDRKAKLAFFAQLGHALRHRHRWALFVMREDYLAALDPYLRPIPTRLGNTYRLDNLGVNAAQQAIQQPVQENGVTFVAEAVNKLVNDLRLVQIQRPDGTMEVRPGPYVEPVQLQVVCYHLWDQLPADKMEINEGDLTAIGNVDQSLAEYYAQQVAVIANKADVKERSIRDWFEHQLITEGGIRGQVLMEPEVSSGLENHAIRMLEDAHLIRAEKRLGATWFELAHDRLIQPVRKNNAAWFSEKLSLLQRQASLWEQQNRPDTLFLRDEALVEAEKWAALHPDEVSEIDQAFLDECLEVRRRKEEARAAAERERQLKLEAAQKVAEAERLRAEEQAQAASKLRRRAYILGAVLVIAVILAGVAAFVGKLANDNAITARANAVEAQAARGLADDNAARAEDNAATAQAASGLAATNAAIAEDNAAQAQAASTEAVSQQITAEYNAQIAQTQEAIARTQASLARSRELASLALSFLEQNTERTLLLSKEALDVSNTGQALDAILKGLQRNLSRKTERYEQFIPRQEVDIYTVAASPDGRKLAWGGSDGLIKVWDLVEQEVSWFNIVTQGVTVNSMAFHPNGTTLVSGDASGALAFWDSESGQRVRNLPSNILEINTLAYSPDGTTLAYGGVASGSDPNLYTRNLEDGTVQSFRIRQGEIAEVLSLAWSPDGQLLASTGRDQIVHIWDASTGLEIETLKNIIVDNTLQDIYEGPVRALAFSPNGKWLATGGDDNQGGVKNKTLLVWDTSAWTDKEPVVFSGVEDDLTALAFSPDGQTLVSGYYGGKTAIWNFNSRQINQTLTDHTRPILAADFSQFEDALLLVTGGLDRTIVMNNLIDIESLHSPLTEDNGSSTKLAVTSSEALRIVGNTGNSPNLWNLNPATGEEEQTELEISGLDSSFFLSPDGNWLALVGEDDQIEIHNLISGETSTISPPPVTINRVSPDGVSTSSEENSVVNSLAFSPSGEILAGGSCSERSLSVDPETDTEIDICIQNEIFLWDVSTGELQKRISTNQSSTILSLAFNPQDENSLAAGYQNAAIQFWDIGEERASGLPLIGGGGPVISLAFHLDGDIFASGSDNNLIALWNINPPQLIGDPLAGADGSITGLAFSGEGSTLYSASDVGTVLRWNLEDWKGIACNLAGRNLTQTEWEQFFPGEEYRETCQQYPLLTPTPTAAAATTSTPTPSPTP